MKTMVKRRPLRKARDLDFVCWGDTITEALEKLFKRISLLFEGYEFMYIKDEYSFFAWTMKMITRMKRRMMTRIRKTTRFKLVPIVLPIHKTTWRRTTKTKKTKMTRVSRRESRM